MADNAQPPHFPFTSPDPLEPPPEYEALCSTEPVARVALPDGTPAWLVTGHQQARQVFADNTFSKAKTAEPDAPRLLPVARGSKSILTMDPPEHTRLRRLVSQAFTPRRIAALRPRIEKITIGLIDQLENDGPPADLVSGLAQPLPITVICELLGVPIEDQAYFRDQADRMMSVGEPDEVMRARQHLNDYFTKLVADNRNEGGDDLLSLLTAAEGDDALDEQTLIAFGNTLLVAGYQTTTAGLIDAVLVLLRHPAQLEELTADPALIHHAVEELLRFSLVGGAGTLRIASEDTQLDEVAIAGGEPVIPSINAANRDPRVFEQPHCLNLHRTYNPHLAFGHGAHYCLGAELARAEMQIALSHLTQRFPNFRLAVAEDELVWQRALAFRRPRALPITW